MEEIQVIGFDYYGQINNVPRIMAMQEGFSGLKIPGFNWEVDITVHEGSVEVDILNDSGNYEFQVYIPFGAKGYATDIGNGAVIRTGGYSVNSVEILFCNGDKLLFSVICYK